MPDFLHDTNNKMFHLLNSLDNQTLKSIHFPRGGGLLFVFRHYNGMPMDTNGYNADHPISLWTAFSQWLQALAESSGIQGIHKVELSERLAGCADLGAGACGAWGLSETTYMGPFGPIGSLYGPFWDPVEHIRKYEKIEIWGLKGSKSPFLPAIQKTRKANNSVGIFCFTGRFPCQKLVAPVASHFRSSLLFSPFLFSSLLFSSRLSSSRLASHPIASLLFFSLLFSSRFVSSRRVASRLDTSRLL